MCLPKKKEKTWELIKEGRDFYVLLHHNDSPCIHIHKPRLSLARELHVHEGLRTDGFLSSCSPPSTFFECEKQGVLLFVYEGETLLP